MDLAALLESWGSQFAAVIRSGHTSSILIPCFVGLVLLEGAIIFIARSRWTYRDVLPNLASAIVSNLIGGFTGVLFAGAYLYLFEHVRLVSLPFTAWGFVAAFVAFEFAHYVQHWLGHRTGLFWAVHSVHHSTSEMNVVVATRAFWGIAFFQPVYLLLPFVGVSIVHLAAAKLFSTIPALISHTKIVPKLGFMEHLFMTPANHRVHHGRQVKYLDTNYGQTLLIFDKLFRTHQLEEEEPEYGLVDQVERWNPLLFQTDGFRRLWRDMSSAQRLRDKLLYLVMPPGWSHSGDHRTVATLRASARHRTGPSALEPFKSEKAQASEAG